MSVSVLVSVPWLGLRLGSKLGLILEFEWEFWLGLGYELVF